MTETQQVLWFALAAAAGIVIGIAGSLWIDVLFKRSRVLVFGWLERDQPESARLSVYVKNDSSAPALVSEAGASLKGGGRLPADAAHGGLLPRPLPITVMPAEVSVVCMINVDSPHGNDEITGCYIVSSGGRMLRGPVFRHGLGAG